MKKTTQNITPAETPPKPKTAKETLAILDAESLKIENGSSNVGSVGSVGFVPEGIQESANDQAREFPIECLPSALRDIVAETAKTALVPTSLSACCALGAISASIGYGAKINSGGGRTTTANLYIMGIAESGTGKGMAYNIVMAPFKQHENEYITHWTTTVKNKLQAQQIILSNEMKLLEKAIAKPNTKVDETQLLALEKTLSKQQDVERQLKAEPGFSVEDVTKEKLAVSFTTQPGEALASLSSEARGIFDIITGNRHNGGKSSDEDLYCKSFSCEPTNVARISRDPVSLNHPCLTITWLVQPDAAKSLGSNASMNDSGLLPRFLIAETDAIAEDEPLTPYCANPQVLETWADLIHCLLDIYRANGDAPITIGSSPEAYEAIRLYTNESKARTRSKGDLQDIAPYPRRWGEITWRLALNFHLAEYGADAPDHELSENTAKNAITIMRWFADQQIRFLSTGRSERRRSKLRNILSLINETDGSQTLRILEKNHGYKKEVLEELCENYPEKLEIIKFSSSRKGGRRSTVLRKI